MSVRTCWTCNTEHDLDDRCAQLPMTRVDTSQMPMPFAAAYEGVCSGQGDHIYEGDSIHADGDGGWVHVGCEA